MSAETYDPPRRHGAAYWTLVALGVLLAVVGAPILAGGAWLIALGGSWYYLFAGIGLVASGVFLIRQSFTGVWIYLLTWVFTLVWALWEAGLDGWAQVPRLVAPTVLLALVLLSIPLLRRSDAARRRDHAGDNVPLVFTIILAAGLGVAGFWSLQPGTVAAQDNPSSPSPEEMGQPEAPSAEQQTEQQQPTTDDGGEPDARPEATLETGADWPAYAGTPHATRYSPLDQITPENVADLELVWEYRTGDLPTEGSGGNYAAETTPLKVGDNLYLCSAKNVLIALDADTGAERWRYDPVVSDDAIPYSASCRGVAYYATPGLPASEFCATRIIEGTLDARLIAVDAQTGQPCPGFGDNGEVNLLEGIGDSAPGFYSVTSPPVIVRGVAVVGAQVLDGQSIDAPSGVVRGYDAETGELAWAWDMMRPPGVTGAPPEGETYARGTPNMWTIASADPELGYVYLPMGNSAVDYYGATRTPTENEFSTSLVAIDVATGEPVWHFQTVHYDVWDYDLGSTGTLVDFPTENGPAPAIVLTSKQGDIYVLDRRTGEPLTPVEERPVPQGGVEPENLSPTQPFSGYHTLARAPLEEEDMWGMSPLDQLWCRIQFQRAAYEGIYTPPTTDRHWIQYPGYNGGSDWGGIAIDEERGIIVANYNDMPNHNRLIPREEAEERGWMPVTMPGGPVGDPQVGVPYAIDVNAGWRVPLTGLLCKEPPYGGIRAIDLETGDIIWDHPFGTAKENGPFGIPSMLPVRIGTPNNGGPIITAGGLIFIAATTDNMIRAIDIETGEVLWEDELPAGGQATPMTYEVDGRQFIGFMAGGHHFMETPIGDYVLGYALPEG